MIIFLLLFSFSAFSWTDYEDLLAWKHVPATALEEHPFWNVLHQIKATTPQGEEMRVYVNRPGSNVPSSCIKKQEGLMYFAQDCIKKNPCLKNFNGKYDGLMS